MISLILKSNIKKYLLFFLIEKLRIYCTTRSLSLLAIFIFKKFLSQNILIIFLRITNVKKEYIKILNT